MTATHTVSVELDEDGTATYFAFACSGGPEDECHQWCAEGCEENCTGDYIVLWPNTVALVAQAPTGAHQWKPDPQHGESCRIVNWLDACGGYDSYADDPTDEPFREGVHPITEFWDDQYFWTYAEPVGQVTDAGVPR